MMSIVCQRLSCSFAVDQLIVLLPIIVGFVASWLLLRLLLPFLSVRLPDHPNIRSSHNQPTPRGGGLSFVIVSLIASIFSILIQDVSTSALLILASIPLAAVGLVDDRYNIPSSYRLIVQIITAIIICSLSSLLPRLCLLANLIPSISLPFCFLLLAVAVVVVVAVINFINFMDGVDGLVAGSISIGIGALLFALEHPWPMWVLVGSLVAFITYNWSPSKVFMGDVGSTFLGAVFAGLLLQASSLQTSIGFLLVLFPLLSDACLCLLRRLLLGQRIFQPHRLHLYQRLHQAGWSHARVSCAYMFATALLSVSLLCGGIKWVFLVAFAELIIGFWLDRSIAVPFNYASKRDC